MAEWKCAWSRSSPPVPETIPPVFLATAIEAVIRAGEVQMAHFGREMRVEKKGTIDLVTEIDLRVEREFRAMIAERFPDHLVLGEEFSPAEDRTRVAEFCWVFEPVQLGDASALLGRRELFAQHEVIRKAFRDHRP